MKPVICFEMLYPHLAPEEKIVKIAGHGFSAVEFWSWRDKDIDAIKTVCAESGIEVANFSAQRRGDLIDARTHGTVMEDLESSLAAAASLGTSTLMVLGNELGADGVVVNPHDGIPPEEKRSNLVAGIRRILGAYPSDMNLVIEPLNTIVDHVGYFLPSVDVAAELVEEIGDSRFGILCDLYHQGIMGDDPVTLIERHAGSFGYVHVAEFPGRNEPGVGSHDWADILRRLPGAGYDGWVGFEFSPQNDSDRALESIAKMWRRIGT